MKYPLIKIFHLSNLLQMLNNHRIVGTDFLSTSHVCIRGSASVMTLSWSLPTSNGQPLRSSPSKLLSPLQKFLNHHCTVGVCVCVSCLAVSDSATPQTAAHQAPRSMGFSRQEHWSGLPFPSPKDYIKKESEVAQSCLTLCNPMDCSLPDSPIHGIFQATVLEWDAISFVSSA